MWYYNEGDNPKSPVGAVISIDVAGFETILEALGSVSLPAYDVVVTPENFREVVYDIRAFGEGELPHKRFVAALYRQILSDWQASADPEDNARLLGALLALFRKSTSCSTSRMTASRRQSTCSAGRDVRWPPTDTTTCLWPMRTWATSRTGP